MILVVGLSPAWQRTLEFNALATGEVNRARRVVETASGKGVNVSRVAHTLGAEVRLLTVAGGQRGALLARSLKAQGISAHIVHVTAETRICQTVLVPRAVVGRGHSRGAAPSARLRRVGARGLQQNEVTELVEEAGLLTRAEIAAVWKAFTQEVRRASLVVLTGTVPRGCGEDIYARLVMTAWRAGVPTLVDAQEKLLINAAKSGPMLVRVNRKELLAVASWRKSTARRAGESVSEMQTWMSRCGVGWIVVSDGARRVSAYSAHEQWSVTPPRVNVVNAIGSGDAMLAGIAVGLEQGQTMRGALRLGAACGAANALTATAGVVRLEDVRRLLREVTAVG